MTLNPGGFTFEAVDFDPFASMVVTVPSTEAQREIFTSVLLGGDGANCAYNESVTLRLTGPLNRDFLKKSFEQVILRHEALRAVFTEDGTALSIAPYVAAPWEEVMASGYDDPAQVIGKYAREATLHAFDVLNGPLIRALLITFNDHDHALLITGHHIVCDGWSLSMLIRDLSTFYSSLIKPSFAAMAPAVKFSAYAVEQERWQHSAAHQEVEKYWLDQYQGDIPVVEFPTDYPRPALRSFHARRIDLPVPPLTVAALRQLSRKTNTSFVTLMLSAFESFMYRITGQEELVVGLPAAGQNVEGLYNLVGHCVNLLPLRSQVDPRLSFTEYLKKRRSYLFDAFDHQQFTFGSLIQKLNLHRDPSRIPLVPVVMNVDIGFTEGFHFEGCTFKVSTNPRYFENFEIFLNASGQGDELILECTFNSDLFEEQMMRRRMEEFITLLNSVVADPETSIGTLNVVPPDEEQFMARVNATQFHFEKPIGIHECIQAVLPQLRVNHPAVVSVGRTLTYDELEVLSDLRAAVLQEKNIGPGRFVGVCIPRTVDLPVTLLAVLKSGAAYLPLDPAFPPDRLRYKVEDAGAELVIITRDLQERLQFPEDRVLYFDDFITAQPSKPLQRHPVNMETPAYVLYTSGSTGTPKGVLVKHAGVTNLLNDLAPKMGLDREEQLLAITTISFDISVLELFMPLLHGACVHIASREQAMDPLWIATYIEKNSIRFMQATPATFELMFHGGWRGKRDLAILCGGEALRIELAEKLLSCTREIWNLYGPTETTIWSTISFVIHETLSRNRNGIMSIGRPVANTRLFVMDVNGSPCPVGVAGELWIAGAGVSAGYLNLPELTREKFLPAPDGEGLAYRTGDRVLMDAQGRCYFLNRLDHQVKIRGFRIELGEIETALNSSPEIKQSVVMALPDKSGQNALVVWYTPSDPAAEEQRIVQACKARMAASMPDYMIPTQWVRLASFPLTPNGKINRNALPKPGEQSSPVTDAPRTDEALTPTQAMIRKLWEETLQLQHIRLDDDFFELGGHSILAVKIMVDLEKMTHMKLPLAVLFTSPTIRKLSELYERPASEEHWNPIVPLKTTGTNKALYFAHGISGNVFKYHALAQRLESDQPGYGLQAFGLNGKDVPFREMSAMAAYHVKELRAFQPEGPYLLAGGSFGGYLAFEMARQLKKAGQEVPLVLLFDIDAGKKSDFLPAGMKQLVHAQLKAERMVKRAFELAMADREERNKYFEARKKMQQRNNDIESWLEKHKMTEMIGQESAAYFRRIEESCHDALMQYKIQPYDGDILLIRAKNGFFNNEYNEDLGWSNFIQGNVYMEMVNGDHNSIFWEPNVDQLASVVTAYLQRVMP